MTDSDLHIGSATLDDLPVLADLLFDLFNQEKDFTANHENQLRGLQLILENPSRGRIFVLRHQGEILGMINLLITISTAEGGFVLMLEDLVIRPDHRNCGFGSRLVEYASEYARSKNFLRITLVTDDPAHNSVPFFERHHFTSSDMLVMRSCLENFADRSAAQK